MFVIPSLDVSCPEAWYVGVEYGSSTVSDTLEMVNELPEDKRIEGHMTMALHVVQNIKKMENYKPWPNLWTLVR